MQLIYTNTAWFCRVQYCWVTARYLNINKQVALSCTDKCSSDQCQNLHTLKSRSRLARPHAEIWWTAWPAWICVSAYIGFCVAAAPLADRWHPPGSQYHRGEESLQEEDSCFRNRNYLIYFCDEKHPVIKKFKRGRNELKPLIRGWLVGRVPSGSSGIPNQWR